MKRQGALCVAHPDVSRQKHSMKDSLKDETAAQQRSPSAPTRTIVHASMSYLRVPAQALKNTLKCVMFETARTGVREPSSHVLQTFRTQLTNCRCYGAK